MSAGEGLQTLPKGCQEWTPGEETARMFGDQGLDFGGGIVLFFLTFLVEHSTSRCALPTSINFCFHSLILSYIIKLVLIVLKLF